MESYFDGQRDNERVQAVWRRNLATLLKPGVLVVVASLFVIASMMQVGASLLTSLLLGLWLVTIPFYMGLTWYRWWNDLYILTNQRLVDIDQKSLFHRIVTELPLENVQDVTYEQRGLFQTFIHFGTVTVQTASGSTEISIEGVTDPQAVQQRILRGLRALAVAGQVEHEQAGGSVAQSRGSRETQTFLFTDLVGSTSAWEKDRAAMERALAHHDQLLTDIIAASAGRVFKTVGDAVYATFPNPTEALRAAVKIQQQIVREDWSRFGDNLPKVQIRIAIHTGTAQARDNDFFGPALNRTARVLGVAQAGQILLSQSAYELVQDDLPKSLTIHSLGRHRLKGLQRPEAIYAVSGRTLKDLG